MGQSKDGGYQKLDTTTGAQNNLLDQILKLAPQLLQQSAKGYQDFLPGGQGNNAITEQANQNFQQNTLPSILNSFGSGAKTSSALNQALAAGASNLNTNIAAQNAQNQLAASQGLGGLGQNAAALGTQTNQFAYAPRQQPFWQSALLAGLQGGSNVASSSLGGTR